MNTPGLSSFSGADLRFMQQALAAAEQGLYGTDPNPRVGCVLVRDDRVIATGIHRQAGGDHAEIDALRQAGAEARGAHAYVTLEPCVHQGRTGPCTRALIEAGIKAVTYACEDPDPQVAGQGVLALREAGLEVRGGLLADQARMLNRGFFSRHLRGRPWVRLKLAVSLDGRIAAADGSSQWITGTEARQDNQHWRARASAVLTGSGTVKADNPRLNVRLEGAERQPLRIALCSDFSLSPETAMLNLPGSALVAGCRDGEQRRRLEAAGVDTLLLPAAENGTGVHLPAMMTEFTALPVNELHVECGPVLAGSLMQSGFVDELLVYQADSLLGDQGLPMFALPGLTNVGQAIRLGEPWQRQFGQDRRLHYLLGEFG